MEKGSLVLATNMENAGKAKNVEVFFGFFLKNSGKFNCFKQTRDSVRTIIEH